MRWTRAKHGYFFGQNARAKIVEHRHPVAITSRKRKVFQNTESFQVKSLYSRTSTKRSPIKRQTFIRRPAVKVPEKLSAIHSNKNFYSTATSSKRLPPAPYRPKVILFCFIPLSNGLEDLKLDDFSHLYKAAGGLVPGSGCLREARLYLEPLVSGHLS